MIYASSLSGVGGTLYFGDPHYHDQGPITYPRNHKIVFEGPFIGFSGIFVNIDLIRGLFVAPSGVSFNTNPTHGHKDNLLTHLPYKRRKGGGGEGLLPDTSLALFLFSLRFLILLAQTNIRFHNYFNVSFVLYPH
jgi:hypothetical protein